MNKWLASIQSLQEAQIILSDLPDILDLKDPLKGALGALSETNVLEIVEFIDKQCLVSATIGDLPMDAELISNKLISMAETGVDYVKIGLFADLQLTNCITELTDTISLMSTPVIAVLFADLHYDTDYLHLLKEAGFKGVMVDTAIKNGSSLLDHWQLDHLSDFITAAHQHDLICGLAGALRQHDIAELKNLDADYLGFRSALCQQHIRSQTINLDLVKQVQHMIKN